MLQLNFTPFPGLTTERLLLRPLKISDAAEIFELRSNKRVNQYLNRPIAQTIEDALTFIDTINKNINQGQGIFWVITFKNSQQLIGTICFWNISKELLKAEMGYELLPDHQGKGVMKEVMPKVIEYGFETMKLQSIEADVDPDNLRSIKLLEDNHFASVAGHEQDKNGQQEGISTVIYSLTKKV